jgi:hypothetical protein
MNDEFSIDPALESLAARVSALRPKLPEREAQDLLYQCAFAAGQKVAARRARRWQIASGAMAVLLLGASISLVNERVLVARRDAATMDRAASTQVQTSHNIPRPLSRVAAVPLDAWQVRTDTAGIFETALARFGQLDTNSRSLAVGNMACPADRVP